MSIKLPSAGILPVLPADKYRWVQLCHDEQHFGPYCMALLPGVKMTWYCPSCGHQTHMQGPQHVH